MNIEIPENILIGKFPVVYDRLGDKKLDTLFFNYVDIDGKKVIIACADFTDDDLKKLEMKYGDVICDVDDIVNAVKEMKYNVVRVLYNDKEKAYRAWLKLQAEKV